MCIYSISLHLAVVDFSDPRAPLSLTAPRLQTTRADVQLFIVVARPAALLGHGARAGTGVASEDAAAAVGDPNMRNALEDKAAEAVVADAPTSIKPDMAGQRSPRG